MVPSLVSVRNPLHLRDSALFLRAEEVQKLYETRLFPSLDWRNRSIFFLGHFYDICGKCELKGSLFERPHFYVSLYKLVLFLYTPYFSSISILLASIEVGPTIPPTLPNLRS